MKKYLLFLLSIIFFSVLSISAQSAELVTNGGFESGVFSPWGHAQSGVSQAYVDSIQVQSGNYSMRAYTTSDSSLGVHVYQQIQWQNPTYISFWVRSDGVHSTRVRVMHGKYDIAGSTYIYDCNTTGTTWTQYNFTSTGFTDLNYTEFYITSNNTATSQTGYLDTISYSNLSDPPVADFTANVTTVTSAQPIQFTDTSTNSPTSWAWDFNGDGVNDSTVQNPVVTYGTAGTYTVSLTATNAAGSDTETKTGYITITDTGGCIACNFSAVPISGYTPLTVQFTDLSAVEPDTWAWNFGDGDTSTEQNPEHIYTAAGTYTVTMTVTKDTAVKTKTKTGYITVTDYVSPGGEDPGPYSCDFTANVTSGTVPLTVLFNDTSTEGADSWTWGIDGIYQADTQDLTVTFNTAGLYSINHTASGPAGSGSKTKTDYIHVYEANHGGIYGYIYDAETNDPIENVNCQFSNTSATASILSDSTGYYYFWPVWNGIYNLTVSKNGYTTGILPNTVIEGNTLRQDIYLTPSGDSVTSGNISNYSSNWLSFTLSTNEVNKTIALTYAITNGTAAYANCTIYDDTGIVYSSNISTNSGTFTFTGIPNTNYLVSFDVMNSYGNRYSGAYPILFFRGLQSGWNVFPPDMPQGIINAFLIFLALMCMAIFGKAYIEIGMILGTAVLAASYVWGFLNLPDSIQTPVIIFLTALIAGGEYIAKKKILG